MTDAKRDTLIGQSMQEHKRLKQHLGCLAAKADLMHQVVKDGLRLIKGEATGHMKDRQQFVATRPHDMMVEACNWPSVEAIAALVEDRKNTEKRLTKVTEQLRAMGMGDYSANDPSLIYGSSPQAAQSFREEI